jgi:hypothetical protein
VLTGSDPLPISEITTTAGNRQVVHFAGWDTPVTVTAPAGATPLASVH